MTSPSPAKDKVEAILFASGKAMEEQEIGRLASLKPKELKDALKALQSDYEGRPGALFVLNEGTKWKLNIKEDYIPLVKSIVAETELDRQTLETLALIAYRNPVLQSEIVNARGERAYEHIGELVERGFITKEKAARSFKLKITDKFYHYFDVHSDKELREALSEATPPTVKVPQAQQKLGELEVVDAATDEEEAEALRQQARVEIYEIEQQREADKTSYLSEFEERLGHLKGRVDEAEKDILEQKAQAAANDPTPEEQTGEGNPTPQATAPDAETVKPKTTKRKKRDLTDPQELVKSINEDIDELTRKEE